MKTTRLSALFGICATILLVGCSASPPDLDEVSNEQLLGMLPNESEIRTHYDVPGDYYRQTSTFDTDEFTGETDSCALVANPWSATDGGKTYTVAGISDVDSDGTSPRVNVSITPLENTPAVSAFITKIKDAAGQCVKDDPEQHVEATEDETASGGTLYVTSKADTSGAYALVPVKDRVLVVYTAGDGVTDINKLKTATKAFYKKLAKGASDVSVEPVPLKTPESSAATESKTSAEQTVAGEADTERIHIGIPTDKPGLGVMDKGPIPEGLEADMARYVANRMGYADSNIDWIGTEPMNREVNLQNGITDMVFSTYIITEQRQAMVDFAGPYLQDGTDVAYRSDDFSIAGLESVNGKKICSTAGSTVAMRFRDEYAPNATMLEADTLEACIKKLVDGEVDAVPGYSLQLAGIAGLIDYSGQVKLTGTPYDLQPVGVGLAKGSELCADVNEAITSMVNDGSWSKIVSEHFGDTNFGPLEPPMVQPCN